MRRFIGLLLILLFSITQPCFADVPVIEGESAILVVADTGEILFSKNSDAKMYPASTTKILTAIIIIEDLLLTDTVIGDREAAFTGGSRIYIMEEEVFTVEELLYALLLESANDAAVALAKKHSGSVEAFAQVMNERALSMGATQSHFVTPNGLHDDNHYTTAADMAKIAAYAMKNETFRGFVKTYQHDLSPTNKQVETRHLYNSNRFLYGTGSGNRMSYKGQVVDIKYDIVDGIKTGYTTKAQNCFVGSAVKNDQRLISVVFKSAGTAIYTDSRLLLDYGFEAFTQYKILSQGDVVDNIKIPGAAENRGLDLVAETDVYKYLLSGETSIPVETRVDLLEPLPLPIEEGQILGQVSFLLDGQVMGSTNLLAAHSVDSAGILSTLNAVITEEMRQAAQLDWWIKNLVKVAIALLIWRILATLFKPRRKRTKRVQQKPEEPSSPDNNVRPFKRIR